MCYPAFLACVSEMICDPADMRAAAHISMFGRGGGYGCGGWLAVPVSLLSVNIELVFAKHGSGKKSLLCVYVCRCLSGWGWVWGWGGECRAKVQDGSGLE